MVSGKGAKRVRSSSHLRHEMCGNVNIGQVHTSDITTTQYSHNDKEKISFNGTVMSKCSCYYVPTMSL